MTEGHSTIRTAARTTLAGFSRGNAWALRGLMSFLWLSMVLNAPAQPASLIDLGSSPAPGGVLLLYGPGRDSFNGSLPQAGVSFGEGRTGSELIAGGFQPSGKANPAPLKPLVIKYSGNGTRQVFTTMDTLMSGALATHSANLDGYPADETVLGVCRDTGADEVEIQFGADTVAPGFPANKSKAPQIMRVKSASPGSMLGRSVASGDVNGDGFRDLIIGAPGDGVPGRTSCGVTYVVFGPLAGPGTELTVASGGQAGDYLAIQGEDDFFRSGYSVACGDFNGDGYDDIIIGASDAALPEINLRSGRVYIVYGRPSFDSPSLDLLQDPGDGNFVVLIGMDSDSMATGPGATRVAEQLGFSTACGDVNGDGFDDILLGAPGGTDSIAGPIIYENSVLAGRGYLLHGGSHFSPGVLRLTQLVATDDLGMFFGLQPGAMQGNAVCLGDLDGDGRDEIILGAWRRNAPGRPDAGGVLVFRGLNDYRGDVINVDEVTPDSLVMGRRAGDFLGTGLTADGDFNQDGVADLAASAYGADTPNSKPSENNAGAVAIILGAESQQSASAAEFFAPGTAPQRAFGGPHSPVLRAWLGFTGGNALAGGIDPEESSAAWAEIIRSGDSISNLSGSVAGVLWHLTTERTGFSSCQVRFKYLSDEVRQVGSSRLTLFQAPSPSGPWVAVPNQVHNRSRREFSATVSELGYFAIGTTGGNNNAG